ncbi:D-glycero-beta-D-manno-heptose-7-phosphate kinase [bacterium]|nr:D-glycero-beta-D-manno-heptose-7-phosphate kinase [bacterium]
MKIETSRLNSIFANFKKQKVIVLGDSMLDEYIWGVVERISPEAPVPVVDVQTTSLRLGGAANVAWNLKKLGAEPILVSIVGEDPTSQRLMELLSQEKIASKSLITDYSRPTTLKTRIIAHHQQVVRVDRENREDIDSPILEEVLAVFRTNLPHADGVIISDYGKGLLTREMVQEVIHSCRKQQKFIAVDPKEKYFQYYKGISIITPNVHETETALKTRIRSEDELVAAGEKLLKMLEAKNVLITRGEKGMSLFQQNGDYYYLPTVAKEVYDVTGAGDTVTASLTLAAISGASYFEAAYISNHSAGIVVGEVGTAAVTLDKLLAHIEDDDCNSNIKKPKE